MDRGISGVNMNVQLVCPIGDGAVSIDSRRFLEDKNLTSGARGVGRRFRRRSIRVAPPKPRRPARTDRMNTFVRMPAILATLGSDGLGHAGSGSAWPDRETVAHGS